MSIETTGAGYTGQSEEDPILQYVTFRLSKETYGINVMQVKEVLRYSEIAPVPGSPAYVLGIINLRGNVVTVIDTSQRFGLSTEEITDNTRIVIIEAEGHEIGILVEAVAEVVYLKQSDIETAPNVGNDESSKYIQGVCNRNNVFLIGEIRDSESMEYALSFAQTGHLCIATIHGNNAKQVLERIRNLFPKEMQGHVMAELSSVLKGIVSQRLIQNHKGIRVPALEIVMAAPEITEIINRGQLDELSKAVANNRMDGMRTFDQSIFELCQSGEISQETALHYAESKHDLSLKLRLSGQTATQKTTTTQFKTKL